MGTLLHLAVAVVAELGHSGGEGLAVALEVAIRGARLVHPAVICHNQSHQSRMLSGSRNRTQVYMVVSGVFQTAAHHSIGDALDESLIDAAVKQVPGRPSLQRVRNASETQAYNVQLSSTRLPCCVPLEE